MNSINSRFLVVANQIIRFYVKNIFIAFFLFFLKNPFQYFIFLVRTKAMKSRIINKTNENNMMTFLQLTDPLLVQY